MDQLYGIWVKIFINERYFQRATQRPGNWPTKYRGGGVGGGGRQLYCQLLLVISLFNWLMFLKKRALHFSTKLNSWDIPKCNCFCHKFCVPSYDLLSSVRKAIFPAPTATGVHTLRNKWSSPLSQLVTKKFNSHFWTKLWTPSSPPQSNIPGSATDVSLSVHTFNPETLCAYPFCFKIPNPSFQI